MSSCQRRNPNRRKGEAVTQTIELKLLAASIPGKAAAEMEAGPNLFLVLKSDSLWRDLSN